MINRRLKQARLAHGFKSSIEFARYAGIEEGTYRHHENGTRGITVHVLRKYAQILDVCPSWLLTGGGDMKIKKKKHQRSVGHLAQRKDAKSIVIDNFLSLSQSEKKEVLKILAGFVHKKS